MKERNFIVKETKGDLPYLVVWISLDGRISSEHYGDYDEAFKHYTYLKELGRQPTILLNLLDIENGKN